MELSKLCIKIFHEAVDTYHETDNVDTPMPESYPKESLEELLFKKNWIDTVQWHLEDIIRDLHIDPQAALALKRRIDRSNQERTDLVEQMDEYFQTLFRHVNVQPDATLNTESPAWAVDRLSILALKIYHMRKESERIDASQAHRDACLQKLFVLLEQQTDLATAIDQLLEDMRCGRKFMKTYKQMKMYNDPSLNPVLYEAKSERRE